MHIDSQEGHVDAIIALVELGADAKTLDYNGSSPVLVSAQSGHVDAIRV